MCRWIAYRGESIKLERYVTAPAHSLVVGLTAGASTPNNIVGQVIEKLDRFAN